MNTILFADGFVGKEIANYLLQHYPNDLSLVVTVNKNEISELAIEHGVPTCVFDTEENISSKIPQGVDLGILAWWPKILKEHLLTIPLHGFINTHPSLLPYNRGKHYNFWALVEEVPFGVTIHRVDAGIDTGPILVQKQIAYDWTDTGETLYLKARDAMSHLFCEAYPLLRTGEIQATPQSNEFGSMHNSSELEAASKIDLQQTYRARDILNLIRARTFEGYPGSWFEEDGVRYEVSIKIRKVLK